MSPDINYLYGAELEYLLGGYNNSVSNLNKSRNIICGVRETMNFAASYEITEINEAICAVADTAATAVAATGVGAAVAPCADFCQRRVETGVCFDRDSGGLDGTKRAG